MRQPWRHQGLLRLRSTLPSPLHFPAATSRSDPALIKRTSSSASHVSLIGAGSSDTIIDATGLSNALYIDGLDNPGLRNVTVSGFTAENANFEGLLVTNAANVMISGTPSLATISSSTSTDDTCPGQPPFETGEDFDCGEGIHIMGVSYSTIFSNNVSANNSGGLLISDDTGEPTTISSPATSSRTTLRLRNHSRIARARAWLQRRAQRHHSQHHLQQHPSTTAYLAPWRRRRRRHLL